MPYSGHLGTLFAKPHKWTALHRDLLRVKEDQVSPERLVGSTYLPQDGDQGKYPLAFSILVYLTLI